MAPAPQITTNEVLQGVDLTGATAVVTGASSGLGTETARALASAGARVVLVVRDPSRGRQVLDELTSQVGQDRFEMVRCDLASLDSVRACATQVVARHPSLQLLINNAGVMACPLEQTADGFERQLGTNHLGHFAFSALLRPALVAGAPSRVVNLSSRGHQRSGMLWEDPHYRERPYDKWEAYGQSKSANVLFTVELDRRLAPEGVRSFAVHPGVIMTNLSRHLTRDDLTTLASNLRSASTSTPDLALKAVEAGAATSVWAAVAPELSGLGGLYLEDCRVSMEPSTSGPGVAPWAVDPGEAARLWEWSQDQVGEALDL